MWLHKKETIKTSYYRTFLLLIVVPILIITLCSIAVIRRMVKDSAIQSVRRAQDNIVSTLTSEVKDVSLRLSHFVYVNDNEIMRIASKTDTSDVSQRYHYTELLTESFNYAMVPIQDILSAIFFMKDGQITYMKDNTVLSISEVKASAWYQAALAAKNQVRIGFYDTNVTNYRKNAYSLTVVAALSPGRDVDRDENIETIALFMTSRTGTIIKNYNREQLLGSTMLLSPDGEVLFDTDDAARLLPEWESSLWEKSMFQHRVDAVSYVSIVSREPETGCLIVSIVNAQALMRSFNRAALIVVGITLILFALFYRFSSYFLRNIAGPVHAVVEGMEQVERGSLDIHLEPAGQAELRTMVHSFNSMVRRLKSLIKENEEQQKRKHEAEIRALQSQINPHFLVNSLNSIRFMAQVAKFDGIRRMAEALIKILSTSFRSNSGFYTVKEELEVLDGFVYLMKIRYSEGFTMEYHVSPDCLDGLVPRLILQPLVENSIVHGFSELIDEIGRIDLTICREQEQLQFIVRDNGKGISPEEIKQLLNGGGMHQKNHTSVGVVNVRERLRLNYGRQCELNIESQVGSYTQITIRIPAVGSTLRVSQDAQKAGRIMRKGEER